MREIDSHIWMLQKSLWESILWFLLNLMPCHLPVQSRKFATKCENPYGFSECNFARIHGFSPCNLVWKAERFTWIHLHSCFWPNFWPCSIGLICKLKAYSQILYRGHSQKFQNLNFLYPFVALLQKAHFSKGIKQKSFPYEMRAIFCIKSRQRDLISHSSLWSNANARNQA